VQRKSPVIVCLLSRVVRFGFGYLVNNQREALRAQQKLALIINDLHQ
jgi:hypothetical protein